MQRVHAVERDPIDHRPDGSERVPVPARVDHDPAPWEARRVLDEDVARVDRDRAWNKNLGSK